MRKKRGKHVLVFVGGGIGPASGGVGRLMDYLVLHWARIPAALPARIIDTRGGGHAGAAALCFLRAMALLVADGLSRRASVAHIHMTTRGSAVRKSILCVAARLVRVPVILHLHGADFFAFHAALPPVARLLLRWILAGAQTVVVIGAEWQQRLVRELGLPPDHVRIVLNGVPSAPRAHQLSGPPHILFLGRIGARKGVGDLIAALASPVMASRDWTATIAGDGDATPYHAQIRAAGLQHRVRMPGWQSREQADALLDATSILVLPSHHEVMPMAVLEAMARGIAIVTTPVGSIPEILRNGVSARLVRPGAPPVLALAMAGLLDSPGERTRLGDAALEVFNARLEVSATAAQIQALYRQAASSKLARTRPVAFAAPQA